MQELVDQYGRKLDDLDILKCRVYAQQIANGGSYSVVSADGVPICGFVSGQGGEVLQLVYRASREVSFPRLASGV